MPEVLQQRAKERKGTTGILVVIHAADNLQPVKAYTTCLSMDTSNASIPKPKRTKAVQQRMGSGPGLDLWQLLHLHEPPPPPAAPGQAAAVTPPSETAASRLVCWHPLAAAFQPLLQPTCCLAAPQLLCASAALTQAAATHRPETPVDINANFLAVPIHTGRLLGFCMTVRSISVACQRLWQLLATTSAGRLCCDISWM